MRVLYDEDEASYIGPAPCGVFREEHVEASAGGTYRRDIEPRKDCSPGAGGVPVLEGNTERRAIASGGPARRGRRPQHVRTLFIREPGDLVAGRRRGAPPVRAGKA